MKKTFLLFLSIVSINTFIAQNNLTQAIRGTVVDKQSQFPLPGATIKLVNSEPLKGTVTDINGNFRLEDIPVGRHIIEIDFVGYKSVRMGNLMLTSGKELTLNIAIEESVNELETFTVTAEDDKRESLNKMATVSSRTFSVEEAGRYSGSLQDPARMAQNFAGVSGASDDRNDIIIRGNSPLGVLWRMEGIDIPSPNHFSTLGTTGGPVSMLNINNLKNSDFMTSAWSADYGNALSGVFDLKLRNGNNTKREYLGQIGFNGFEFGAEGPFKKGKQASYLINYRYSTLGVFSALGVNLGVGDAVPQYQDVTFKVNVPTQKAGTFTLWGIGGLSYIDFEAQGEVDSTNLYSSENEQARFDSRTAVIGASHNYFFNETTSSKLVIAASLAQTIGALDTINIDDSSQDPFNIFGFDRNQTKLSLNYKLNKKFNAKNTVAIGVMADEYLTDIIDSSYVEDLNAYRIITNNTGNGTMLQSYINWQHKFNDKLTLNTGLHSQNFLLSSSNTIEPRLGLKYKLSGAHSLNLGIGMHSQIQPITLYFVEAQNAFNQTILPNKNLDFNKSIHSVIGHDFYIGENVRLKSEVYYQYIYNVAVDSISSSFSMLNEGTDFVLPDGTGYENTGTGYNYGLELTLEKFFSNSYYFLVTSSLFESKYEGSDQIERNTAFNGNYVLNALGGKEFKLNEKSTLSFDTKITYAGGRRFTAIDLNSSILAGSEVRDDMNAFEQQFPDYFRTDFKITYRRNGNKVAQQFSIDLQNFTGQQNIFQYGYNNRTQSIGTIYQRGFFPDVQYKLFF